MKVISLTCFVLLASLVVARAADGDNRRGKAHRYYALNDDLDEADHEFKMMDSNQNVGASSGRLFMKKFFFKNMFGQNQTPQIIPIIITGGNADDGSNFEPTVIDTPTDTQTFTPAGTTTTTNTDTVTPTGDDTVNPVNPVNPPNPMNPPNPVNPQNPVNPLNPVNPTDTVDPTTDNRILLYARDSGEDNDQQYDEEAVIVDEKTLAAALSASPEEYIITDQDIKSTSSGKANRAPTHINLRLRSGGRDQLIRLRLPANYHGYIQNGQRVALNGNKRNRPVKRRVIRRRRNRRRPNKNKNKQRRRIVAA